MFSFLDVQVTFSPIDSPQLEIDAEKISSVSRSKSKKKKVKKLFFLLFIQSEETSSLNNSQNSAEIVDRSEKLAENQEISNESTKSTEEYHESDREISSEGEDEVLVPILSPFVDKIFTHINGVNQWINGIYTSNVGIQADINAIRVRLRLDRKTKLILTIFDLSNVFRIVWKNSIEQQIK